MRSGEEWGVKSESVGSGDCGVESGMSEEWGVGWGIREWIGELGGGREGEVSKE